MRTLDETARINRMLMSNGLGKLDDPGLARQLGFLFGRVVRDHAEFRMLLTRCEPEQRRNMYETVKPYLRFEPKPLDAYLAESADIAERKQLPTLGPNGELLPFKIPELQTAPPKTGDLAVAQRVIDESFHKFQLSLLCKQCTREETFGGLRKEDCVTKAREAGWQYVLQRKPIEKLEPSDGSIGFPQSLAETISYELCPKCAGYSNNGSPAA